MVKKIKGIIALAALATAVAAVVLSGRNTVACEDVDEGVVRLHIVANSDSAFDQAAKLKVRDAVLKAERSSMEALTCAADAKTLILNDAEKITEAAREALDSLGVEDAVRLSVGDYAFPTRTYQDKTYPAGIYTALRVTIGEGAGHNWWCVMFPPLCIVDIGSQTAVLDPNNMDSLLLELIKRIDGGNLYAWIEKNWRW